MHPKILRTLITIVATLACVAGWYFLLSLEIPPSPSSYRSISKYVNENRALLEEVAEAAAVAEKPGAIDTSIKYSPSYVDQRGNVYFWVYTNLWSTTGFVRRNGDAQFYEDGMELDIVEERHIVGDWWYYIGS